MCLFVTQEILRVLGNISSKNKIIKKILGGKNDRQISIVHLKIDTGCIMLTSVQKGGNKGGSLLHREALFRAC